MVGAHSLTVTVHVFMKTRMPVVAPRDFEETSA